MSELLAVVVAGGEGCEMEVEEALGELVTDGDPVEERCHPRSPFVGLAVPYRRLALLDVRLIEREGQEPDVEVGAVAHGRDDGFVGVAGEGAAVVETDGDLAWHRETSRAGTVLPAEVRNPQATPAIPPSNASAPAWRSGRTRGRATCPRRRRTRQCIRTYTRLAATRAASSQYADVDEPSDSSVAAMKAEVACPDGKALVRGRRIP